MLKVAILLLRLVSLAVLFLDVKRNSGSFSSHSCSGVLDQTGPISQPCPLISYS